MEDQVTPKSKPGLVLILSAFALLALSAFLFYALAMRKSGNPSYALGYSIARAVLAPALFAGLFCIPKKGRTPRRFTQGFVTMSGIMLFLALGEFGRSIPR